MATRAEIDRFLEALIGVESGGDATAQNKYSSAGGLFGYIDSTWANYGGYRRARDAPASVQWAKARADIASRLKRYNGDWRLVAMHHYLPAAAANPSLRDAIPAPEAGNTKTPNEYADIIMSRFTGKQTATSSRTTTSASGGAVADAPRSREELLDYIAENYPDVAALLDISPEVKAVLLAAAEKEYTPAKLRSELAKTKWWRTTVATAREWDAGYARDKATGDALLGQTRTDISVQAQRLGVRLNASELARMALNVRRLGWTQQQVADALAGRFSQRKAKAGLGTASAGQIRTLAADYGVTLSDREVDAWTQRLLAGRLDDAGVRAELINRAKRLYPTIADNLDNDTTVRDYFDPYVQRASQLLGLNPEEVNFTDSKWQRAIARVDPKTGQRMPMDFDQWEKELRTNPIYGFDRSTNGRAAASEFATALQRAMGQVA